MPKFSMALFKTKNGSLLVSDGIHNQKYSHILLKVPQKLHILKEWAKKFDKHWFGTHLVILNSKLAAILRLSNGLPSYSTQVR